MDRSAFDIAITTLELALHQNPCDGEALGAVYAFWRVAKGETLTDICLTMFSPVEHRDRYRRWRAKVEAAENENKQLKNDLGAAHTALEFFQRRTKELEA